ncbi:MAG: hypothetical protein K9M97_05310, partial [Akkermansiaceae bacterium]|nr:hypothetical protein [Akkermansiaceae bacterium]
MSAAADHFIEVTTRPMAHDEEIRVAAETELRERIATHGEGRDAELAEAAATLERSDRSPLRKWRTVLVAAMLLVSLPMLGVGVWALATVKGVFRSAVPTQEGLRPMTSAVPGGLSPAERLLLIGDPTGLTDAERWRPLWQSEPDNPVFLAKYAIAYFNTHKSLSPEIIEAANRVDPDNGWFTALAASGLAKQAIEKLNITTKESQQGKATPWRILDEAKFRESLALAHQAAEQPAFSTYQTEFHQLRVKLVPPPTDFVSTAVTLLHAADSDNGALPLRHLSDALAAAAQACAESHDAAGFDATLGDWLWLCRTTNRTANTLVGQLVAQAMISGPSRSFRDAARDLNLTKQEEILAAVEEHLRLEREELRSNRGNQPIADLVRKRGSFMGALSLPMSSSLVRIPPPLTGDDLRPGRLANHALLDRMLAAAAWLLLGCGAAVAISPGFRGR